VLTDATVTFMAEAANALVAGVPRQAWKLGKAARPRAYCILGRTGRPDQARRANTARSIVESSKDLALVDRNMALVWMRFDLVPYLMGLVLPGTTAPSSMALDRGVMPPNED
jgi:hypothetical protein